ncbi:MAG: FtsJ-like methyltransferase [Hyperionvirus sp.]|uniref:FtsJ-like methyltransferase n=1 Tax=Hyperionvirus sp. TaxID=2487770 RepID=A0A3G5A8H1_9VIRU|nr:MAG: FtsJ-like methyltransferase [Hyperionvirus sp.]
MPPKAKQKVSKIEVIEPESPMLTGAVEELVKPQKVIAEVLDNSLKVKGTASSAASSSVVLPKEADYIPFLVAVPNDDGDKDLASLEGEAVLSTNIDYPLFSLGFHHYLHANKNKMEVLKQFENKKKVYLVMNKFERYIDNYPDDIGHASEKFFEIKDGKPNILSRGFYKLWEVLHMFDLIDLNKGGFISAHLAEGPGSFIQATMFFRDKYAKNPKNDKYYAVTLHPEDDGKHIPDLEQSFIDYYNGEKPKRVILHQTYSKKMAGGFIDRDNGDITDPKTIMLFGGQLGKDKADFITADGGFDWTNENIQEQEAFRLIFAQIYAAIKLQTKGGAFVCKFFETFTNTSIKFIFLLGQMYKNIFLAKPLTSRPSNSEKYIVCTDFRYADSDKDYKLILEQLSQIVEKLHKNGTDNLVRIWDELVLPQTFILTMVFCNTTIANRQLKSINEIKEFIDMQNYYGDVYQMRRQMQIDASKYWIGRFMVERDKFQGVLGAIRQESEAVIDINSNKSLLPKINML